ncbi:MAG: lyase family protein [Leifsonia flava]
MAERPTADTTDWGLLDPLAGSAAVTSDDAVLEALVDVERGLVRAWARVLHEDLDDVADALRPEHLDRGDLIAGARAGGVPVISLVAQLRVRAEAVVPGSGPRVHAGATSQDILDTALVLVARRALGDARERLVAAGHSLVDLATAEKRTLSIARTLGQHAAQSTVGVAVAGWLDGVTAAIDAIDTVPYPVQLGGAVGSGEDFDRTADSVNTTDSLRAALAGTLALDDPGRSWHSERSPILRIASSSALVVTALGRIGKDVAFLARTEIAEVSLGTTGGSSAMPHKRNPVDAVLLSANGLRAAGLIGTVHTAAVSQDARPAGEWHAEWSAFRALLRLAVESADAAASMLAALEVNRSAAELNRLLSPDLERDPEATFAASERIVGSAHRRFLATAQKESR